MSKTKKIVLLALASAAVVANAGEVRRGMTEAQVRSECGRPTQVSEEDGRIQWVYIHLRAAQFNPFDFQAQLRGPDVLSVTFDHGRVRTIERE